MTITELSDWNNDMSLVGYVSQRGPAWRYRASDQWTRPNFYPDAIPPGEVASRLFNWSPVISPLYVKDSSGTGALFPVPGRRAILHSGTSHVLGVFTETYKPVRYSEWAARDVYKLVDQELDTGIAGACLLRNGAIACILLEHTAGIMLDEGLEIRPGIFAATSFDGTFSSTFMRTVNLPGADVMMSATLADVSIGRSPLRYKVKRKEDAVSLISNTAEAFTGQFRMWHAIQVSQRQWEEILDWASRASSGTKMAKTLAANKAAYLRDLWTSDEFVGKFAGTGFGVLLALSTYAHHGAIVRGASRGERNLLNALTGRTFKAEQDAIAALHKILG